jgi:hypothetical protein
MALARALLLGFLLLWACIGAEAASVKSAAAARPNFLVRAQPPLHWLTTRSSSCLHVVATQRNGMAALRRRLPAQRLLVASASGVSHLPYGRGWIAEKEAGAAAETALLDQLLPGWFGCRVLAWGELRRLTVRVLVLRLSPPTASLDALRQILFVDDLGYGDVRRVTGVFPCSTA